jgi:hypothetical protein
MVTREMNALLQPLKWQISEESLLNKQ